MLRTPRLLVVALGVAAALSLNASRAARAGEEEVNKHFDVINSTTGKDVINAQFQTYLKHPSAKKLVAYAHSLAKMDPKVFSYNGAYILAQLARAKKNVTASEALFRICSKQAADLESTQKLLLAYGALIELLYENKKYKEIEKI
jgi:hypothetical protein